MSGIMRVWPLTVSFPFLAIASLSALTALGSEHAKVLELVNSNAVSPEDKQYWYTLQSRLNSVSMEIYEWIKELSFEEFEIVILDDGLTPDGRFFLILVGLRMTYGDNEKWFGLLSKLSKPIVENGGFGGYGEFGGMFASLPLPRRSLSESLIGCEVECLEYRFHSSVNRQHIIVSITPSNKAAVRETSWWVDNKDSGLTNSRILRRIERAWLDLSANRTPASSSFREPGITTNDEAKSQED